MTTFESDTRERLGEKSLVSDGSHVTTPYELDPHGNVECETRESVSIGSVSTGYVYTGNQLRVTRRAPATAAARS